MGHSKSAPPRMGRPPLPSGEVRAERVVTFLTTAQKQQLQLFAEETDQTISAATQDLIRRGLKQEIIENTEKSEGIT
nr:hypothetical protein [uncultured Shimia sp.]